MPLYEIKNIDPRHIYCSGGKSEHKSFFFGEYYQAIFESYITHFTKEVTAYPDHNNTSIWDRRTGQIINYVETIALTINNVSFPGGGYSPEKFYSVPGHKLCFYMLTEVCKNIVPPTNVTLIIPMLDVADMPLDWKMKMIDYSNTYINVLCNRKEYAKLYNPLVRMYVRNNFDKVKHVALTHQNLDILFKNGADRYL